MTGYHLSDLVFVSGVVLFEMGLDGGIRYQDSFYIGLLSLLDIQSNELLDTGTAAAFG